MTMQSPFDQNDRPTPAMNYEIVSRMPWLVAEPNSLWSVSGRIIDGNPFTEHMAIVMPWQRYPGELPVFALFHPGPFAWSYPTDDWNTWWAPQLVPADRINRAARLTLVMADNPSEAYFLTEQDIIDNQENNR